MKAARMTCDAPLLAVNQPSSDGVVRTAGAFVISLNGEPIVTRIDVGDPDAFDDEGCLVYERAEGTIG